MPRDATVSKSADLSDSSIKETQSIYGIEDHRAIFERAKEAELRG